MYHCKTKVPYKSISSTIFKDFVEGKDFIISIYFSPLTILTAPENSHNFFQPI